MSNYFSFEVEFRVPDNVEEENVRFVLNEYFGDLVETERFHEARIVDSRSPLDESEERRFLEMVSSLSDEEIDAGVSQAEELMQG